VSHVDFKAFDADNHYYEAEDAFIRHIEPQYAKRAMQWAHINGKQRLLVGGAINRFIPNPTFDPVAKPGILDEYFRGRNPEGKSVPELFGELEPIRKEYRDREARLAVLDEQGLDGAFMFPTLGVGMEQALLDDPPAMMAAFRAFNRWLDEDWGFNYQDRLFAAPYIPLADIDNAIAELEWALERDMRVFITGVGPILIAEGGRSQADPFYDRFWERVNEAGVVVALHGGDSAYSRYLRDWGQDGPMEAFRQTPLRGLLSHDPVHDTVAAMLAERFFHRFPNIRVASIELGSTWVAPLFQKLKKSFGQQPNMWPEDPRETFKRHVFVSPYYEDDLGALRDQIGASQMLMGSDWPHAEGLAEPTAFIDDLRRHGISDDEARLIMRENGLGLTRRLVGAGAR
jgi:predicted TIM-barrel fold metal-dependent hydrolase